MITFAQKTELGLCGDTEPGEMQTKTRTSKLSLSLRSWSELKELCEQV